MSEDALRHAPLRLPPRAPPPGVSTRSLYEIPGLPCRYTSSHRARRKREFRECGPGQPPGRPQHLPRPPRAGAGAKPRPEPEAKAPPLAQPPAAPVPGGPNTRPLEKSSRLPGVGGQRHTGLAQVVGLRVQEQHPTLTLANPYWSKHNVPPPSRPGARKRRKNGDSCGSYNKVIWVHVTVWEGLGQRTVACWAGRRCWGTITRVTLACGLETSGC